MLRGFTRDSSFTLGDKTLLEPVEESELVSYQRHNHGHRHDLSTGAQLLDVLIPEPVHDYSLGYLRILTA